MNGATVVSSLVLSCACVASAVLGAAKATRATSTATTIGHHTFHEEDDNLLFPVTLLRWKRCMLLRVWSCVVCLDC